jgi:hypothetical protein
MNHDANYASLLARILIAKHGTEAPAVAIRRVFEWARAGDEVAAGLWLEVAQFAIADLGLFMTRDVRTAERH